MKFSLVQSELNRSLQLVAGVVPGKTSNPQHLTSVRIEATPEGKLTFTGTDLDLFLVTTVHGTVEEPGIASIPARRLLEIVKELPADVVQIASTASGISVVCGNGRFRLVGPDPLEFPPVPEMSQDRVFAVSSVACARATSTGEPVFRDIRPGADALDHVFATAHVADARGHKLTPFRESSQTSYTGVARSSHSNETLPSVTETKRRCHGETRGRPETATGGDP